MRLVVVAASLQALVSFPAESQSTSGQDIGEGNGLYMACTGDVLGKGICGTYVMGVSDATNGHLFCAPQGTRRQQATDIVTAGLSAHPEERQRPSVNLVIKYLSEAWPCAANPYQKYRKPQ